MAQSQTNHDNRQDNIETDVLGKQMADLLDAHANRLSMRTLKQLENGRARALQAYSQQSAGKNINSDGTLLSWASHHRMLSTGLILAAFIASFAMVQAFSQQDASDAFLLSADLPPEAFVDRGFEPALNGGQHKNI